MGTDVANLGLVAVGLGSASPQIAHEPDSSGTFASNASIVVDDAHLLFTGDFKRAGSDLIISSDDRQIVIDDYFRGETRAALASRDGAMLTGSLVEALTGEVQYAQAGAAAVGTAVIGKVSKVGGLATVVRNGVSVQLNIGDNVHKGDVVQTATNSSLVLVFVDGTVFGLAASARMVLNEMVYDPNGSSNSSLLSLVQGTITFVAGQTAKNGDMKVDTPVATMGIRGTAVLAEIGFTVPGTGGAPPVRVRVLEEPGGVAGSFVLYSKVSPNTVLAQVSQSGSVTSILANGAVSTETAPPLSLAAQSIIDQTMREYFPNYTPRSISPNGSSSPWGGEIDPFNFDPISLDTGQRPTPPQLRAETPFPRNQIDDIIPLTDVNTPPLVSVSNVVVVLTLDANASSFNITNQIAVIDPDATPDPTNEFHDIPVPYVAGSGRLVASSGAPASLIDFDPQTGLVSYDPADFAFLPQGATATFTIAFDSQSGPHTVHQTLTITIVGVNDLPTVTSAFFTVREGDSVVLTLSNIGVSDPDSTSFTFTVSNVTHGTMEIFKDGVWLPTTSFTTADLEAGHVRFVHDGSNSAPTFSVQANDGFGSSPVFGGTINFAPTVTPMGENDRVFEAGLAIGSAAEGSGEFTQGIFVVADPDGIGDIVNVTINGITFAIGNLAGQVIAGSHGILTVTAYDALSGVASYTYQLTGVTTDAPLSSETDVFILTTSDGTVTSASAALTIEIIDDVPNAVNDPHLITEDTTGSVVGNVLANDRHPNGQFGADLPVSFVGWSGGTTASYGTFVANADGSYSYSLDTTNPLVRALDSGETLIETFAYAIRDADGDIDAAAVTITIAGANDAPSVTVDTGNLSNANDEVFEADIASGSNAAGSGEFAFGTLTLADIDGLNDILTVTVNNETVAIEDLVNHVFVGAHGSLTVTAYDATAGLASYTYRLTSASADGPSGPETDVFILTTSDGTTSSAPTTITVEIVDDAPNAVNDTDLIVEDAVAPVVGNVLSNDVHPNGQSGADAPISFVSWDGDTSANYGTLVANLDGSYSYTLNSANPLVQALDTNETLVETFAYTIRDADGDLDTATLTITITGSNDAPTVTDTHVWLPSDPAQQTAGTPAYANGYPILIGAPSDIDGDSLTITAGSVPAGVYYFDGETYVALEAGTVLFDSDTNLLGDLVYRPTESVSDPLSLNLSLLISDGTTTETQIVGIHEVVQNHFPIGSFGVNGGNSPLTSGNTQSVTQTISQSQADTINGNIGTLTVVVQTDFQASEIDTPVPLDEQGIGTEAGAARETEVSVYLNLTQDGTTTRFVIVADDPDGTSLVQTWFFNATTGLMETQVDADHIFVADANGDPTSMSLSSWLTTKPVNAGDTWDTVYVDDEGGHFQARQFSVEIFPNDPADPGIVVSGDPVLADQIYGTSGNDTLSGNGGDDIIDGRGGNDLIFGGSGADNFKFTFAEGNTVIGDFSPTQDHIDISAIVTASEIDAWFASHVSADPVNSTDTLITLDSNQTITLKNVAVSSLSSSDFIVQAH